LGKIQRRLELEFRFSSWRKYAYFKHFNLFAYILLEKGLNVQDGRIEIND